MVRINNHARKRCKDRFGFKLSKKQYKEVRCQILNKKDAYLLQEDCGGGRSMWAVLCSGVWLPVIFDDLDKALVTVLPDGELESWEFVRNKLDTLGRPVNNYRPKGAEEARRIYDTLYRSCEVTERIKQPAPKAETINPTKIAQGGKADLSASSNGGPSRSAIEELAYQKWEKAGRPEGDGVNFWLEAEKEITGTKK